MPSADQLREFLLAQIAEQCGIRRQDVDPGRPLTELGLSSRGALAVAGPGDVSRTSSGRPARRTTRERNLAGELPRCVS